jgi:hypothetical protein
MPDQEALFMCKCFRQDACLKHIPVIMLSGIDSKTFFHYQKFPGYIGFWGGVLNPPKEADINRLCSQFSLY